ncbi:unnamed protein product [Symbiodinium sp. CCMP2592]|nr:unnamed protein product [Symbiodinium sp. CCMP2592]
MPAVKRKRSVDHSSSSSHKCGHCGKTGHHRTSCPTLAAALLRAAVQYTNPRKLEDHLAQEKPLRLNVDKKQQKSLKRSSGRRFSAQWPRKDDSRSKVSSKLRKVQARLRELRRKPRDVRAALQALRKAKWLWKPGRCSCGEHLQQVPFKASLKRGNGRAYLRCPQCHKWFDSLAFSFLPVLRMPLPTVYKAMQIYFQQGRVLSVDEIGRLLGCSGSPASALKKLVKALRAAECRCMDHKQQLRQVTGDVEADGTSIRHWRSLQRPSRNVYLQYFALYQRPTRACSDRVVNLYQLPLVESRCGGKPPPESFDRCHPCVQAGLGTKDKRGRKTLLISDGAKCYPRLAKSRGVLLRQCNHSGGVFCVKKQVPGRSLIPIHTGSVDSFWNILKKGIPSTLRTHSKGVPNPLLWKYARSVQWRWECDADLFWATGQYLSRLSSL